MGRYIYFLQEEHMLQQLVPVVLIAFGVVVLAVGPRLVVLGAAVGALLGFVLVRFIPGALESALALLIPLIFAVIFAFGGGLMRSMIRLFTIAIGAVAGVAIVLGVIGLLGLDFGLLDWVLAAAGAGIGVVIVLRFKDWAIYVLAGLVGALLIVRGVQIWLPSFNGILALLVGLVLAGSGSGYQSGLIGGRKQVVK
jgi:hypothetical protein